MVFGFTPLDPLVVLFGTLLIAWQLKKNATKVVGLLPVAFSLWFFVPLVTNLTLWQTAPLLLTGRGLLLGKLRLPRSSQILALILLISFAGSTVYALMSGGEATRVVLRALYYIGAFFTLMFAYEMGRRPGAYEALLKGFVVLGAVYSAYGAYQIVAYHTGLPMRGIVYDSSGLGVVVAEGGFLRVNSFANEPKRLGYLLFISAMACIFLARTMDVRSARNLRLGAVAIFAVSIMTFSGSYFLALVLFSIGFLLLNPSRATIYFVVSAVIAGIFIAIFPNVGLTQALQVMFERRVDELDVGIAGAAVYRQEFFAWDYIANNPMAFFSGVGLGQYYSVLNSTYGPVAGIDSYGGLLPLNSNFLELVFDLGGGAATAVYLGVVMLIVRLRLAREHFLYLSLLFLLVQSFSIVNMLYIALFAGLSLGRASSPQARHRDANESRFDSIKFLSTRPRRGTKLTRSVGSGRDG